ncbi:hypothetical protein [Streptomyces sp. NPDC088261]|uniref:hypothetical protein n=1 Tax=Streptomyces sp. NPDC088261 TaxID=3365851 RepID=UPI0037F9A51C
MPDRPLAGRHALRRLAARLVGGEIAPTDVAADEWSAVDEWGETDDWGETDVEISETAGAIGVADERAFLALVPRCACCTGYTVGLDQRTWAAELRLAALALASSAPSRPGC